MAAQHDEPPVEISIGAGLARVDEDRHRPGSYTLVVDGTPQSHVDLDDPTHLAFEYVRRIGHAVDLLPEGPVTALHLGAGALTLPRYVEATRPGSRQQVIELEADEVETWAQHVAATHGFTEAQHVVDVFGLCPACTLEARAAADAAAAG